MSKKRVKIIGLKAIRKASRVSKRAAHKSAHILDRVEHKTTRIIIGDTGSEEGTQDKVSVSDYTYSLYPHIYPVHPALPNLNQRPSVTVFAFLDPKGFYGGIATLLITAASLAQKLGYDLRVAQTTGYSDKTDVLEFLSSNGVRINADRFSTVNLSIRDKYQYAYLPLHPDDIVFVSAWWDAHIASQLPLQKKFVYLIQDYEPIFYNNSDQSALAEATYYSEKFIPLCNTEILYKFFQDQDYEYIAKNAVWFEPAPAPTISKSSTSPVKTKRRLFLYGRPNVHRNLFGTALRALNSAFASGSMQGDWEIFMAGQSDAPKLYLDSGHEVKNLGKMKISKYYEFAQTVDVAVSPMLAPHPNYPTLEFASLGAAVVTTKWKTKKNLSNYSANIIMAEPTEEDMAQKIIEAASIPKATLEKNTKKNHINTRWESALEQPISLLAKKIKAT